MNRRSAPVVLIILLAVAAACRAESPAKVLLIGKQPDHPHGTHMYLHTCEVLAKCLARNGDIQTIVSDGWPRDPKQLEDVRSIVIYTTPAAEFLLDKPHRGQVIKLLDKGVGLVTIHWASSVHQANLKRLGPTWMKYLGGTWVSNVGLHTGKSPLRQLAKQHPVCRGWKPYELLDEYYLNPTIEKATPVLEVRAKDKKVVVGWAYERPGGGRAYATTLGHFYRNFQHKPFRRMIVNAILWTAHQQLPATGANVDLDEQALKLPPKRK